jgi:hypothetical protein
VQSLVDQLTNPSLDLELGDARERNVLELRLNMIAEIGFSKVPRR